MPSYYSWQHKPQAARCADLQAWTAPFVPLYDGLTLALRLLRESGRKSDTVAEQGAYQQMLGGKQFQMLRVWGARRVPEISANKYMIWIRFPPRTGISSPSRWRGRALPDDALQFLSAGLSGSDSCCGLFQRGRASYEFNVA